MESGPESTSTFDNAAYRERQERQDAEIAAMVRRLDNNGRIILACIAGNVEESNDYWLKHY